MIEGKSLHQRKIQPYKNDEEFLHDLEDALLEYLPQSICIDRKVLEDSMKNIDNLFTRIL